MVSCFCDFVARETHHGSVGRIYSAPDQEKKHRKTLGSKYPLQGMSSMTIAPPPGTTFSRFYHFLTVPTWSKCLVALEPAGIFKM
jgi:hypothetical protein